MALSWLAAPGDNKAGVWGNLKTFEALLRANGSLPVNIKIMFEGEEESGSPSIEAFVQANKERLRADLLLNCDGDLSPDAPRLTYAGRGIVSARSARRWTQSRYPFRALWRRRAESAAYVAGQIIGSFHDEAGRVRLPGYYDQVVEASAVEKARIASGFDAEALQEGAGVSGFWGEEHRASVRTRHRLPHPGCQRHVGRLSGSWQQDHHPRLKPASRSPCASRPSRIRMWPRSSSKPISKVSPARA